RLDSLAATLKGGENGAILVPGHPEKSRMILAIKRTDPDFKMPPEDPLSAEQVAVLTEWVRLGAPWPAGAGVTVAKSKRRIITDEDRAWWAFQPVKSPAIPATPDASWARNDIDRFI